MRWHWPPGSSPGWRQSRAGVGPCGFYSDSSPDLPAAKPIAHSDSSSNTNPNEIAGRSRIESDEIRTCVAGRRRGRHSGPKWAPLYADLCRQDRLISSDNERFFEITARPESASLQISVPEGKRAFRPKKRAGRKRVFLRRIRRPRPAPIRWMRRYRTLEASHSGREVAQ